MAVAALLSITTGTRRRLELTPKGFVGFERSPQRVIGHGDVPGSASLGA